MKYEQLYQYQDTASRMEANMYIVAGVSLVAGVLALFAYGFLPCLGFLILAALAYGLSRVFDLLGQLFASCSTPDRTKTAQAPKGNATDA